MTLQKDPEGREAKYLHAFVDFTDKRVLEIGCGEGRLTWKYARRARSVTGLDLDHDALRVATVDRPRDLTESIHFAEADSVHLPFSHETFDIAILAWSL
jgi:ubiquinone/menaquinone biosynthesis C-methylase UbiE